MYGIFQNSECPISTKGFMKPVCPWLFSGLDIGIYWYLKYATERQTRNYSSQQSLGCYSRPKMVIKPFTYPQPKEKIVSPAVRFFPICRHLD